MHIAIMGAGALGSYFGGRLLDAGVQVSLIARGRHLEGLKRDGLKIISPNGDLHIPTINATDDPADIGVVDLVMLFVKNYDIEDAIKTMKPLVGPDTAVATFQNGISAPTLVAQAYGADKVIAGVARIPAQIDAPGVIRHTHSFDGLEFGSLEAGKNRAVIQGLFDALVKAKTTPAISSDIDRALWEKFVLLSATSAITCLTRLNFGQIQNCVRSSELMQRAMDETAEIACAIRKDLPKDMSKQQFDFFKSMGGEVRSSMYSDLIASKRLELEWFSGEVVRKGRELGIPTPVHEVALLALWPYRNGAPQ